MVLLLDYCSARQWHGKAASSAEASLEIKMAMSNDSGTGHCHLTSAKDHARATADWGASPWRGVAWPMWREPGAEGGEGAAARGQRRH